MSDQTQVMPTRPAMEAFDGGLRLHAPAKINLDLLIGPRRADGFHDLDSLVTQITLYDEIEITGRTDGQIVFSREGADCGSDEKNLALRAARVMAGAEKGDSPHFQTTTAKKGTVPFSGVSIRLVKHIPPGKGLGGGSSDAAAVLRGLNELWQLGLPTARLMELGAQLGSDVPLFLGPTAAWMTGRGEVLAAIEVAPFVAILVLPKESTSTAAVYKQFDMLYPDKPSLQRGFAPDVVRDPPSQWRSHLVNDLFAPAMCVCPELRDLHRRLSAACDAPICLTGSGSAMFALFDDEPSAQRSLANLPAGLAQFVLVGPS